jgi:hypothetical protein
MDQTRANHTGSNDPDQEITKRLRRLALDAKHPLDKQIPEVKTQGKKHAIPPDCERAELNNFRGGVPVYDGWHESLIIRRHLLGAGRRTTGG